MELPACFKDPAVFSRQSSICSGCPAYLACGALLGFDVGGLSRLKFARGMAVQEIPRHLAIAALMVRYDVTESAAGQQFDRARKWARRQKK